MSSPTAAAHQFLAIGNTVLYSTPVFPSLPPGPGYIYGHRVDVMPLIEETEEITPDTPTEKMVTLFVIFGSGEIELDLEGSEKYLSWFATVSGENRVQLATAPIQ